MGVNPRRPGEQGKTVGQFLSDVFEWATEHWLILLIGAGFMGYGPCASEFSTKVESTVKEAPVAEAIEKHNDRLDAIKDW